MKKLLTVILASIAFTAIADNNVTTSGAPTTPAAATAPSAITATNTSIPTNTSQTMASNSDNNNGSLYIGAGVGAGWNNQAAPAATFRLDGGYSFDQFWAVEIGTTGLTQSGAAYNQNMQYYDLSVKGTLPINEMFNLFAQIGGAYGAPGVTGGSVPAGGGNVDVHQSSWGAMSGVGIDMNVTKHVGFNLSDLYYYAPSAGIQGNTNVVLLGVKYQM